MSSSRHPWYNHYYHKTFQRRAKRISQGGQPVRPKVKVTVNQLFIEVDQLPTSVNKNKKLKKIDMPKRETIQA